MTLRLVADAGPLIALARTGHLELLHEIFETIDIPPAVLDELRLDSAIMEIRGERVMLDADLAEVYGVTTRRLKEQVRRNRDRFPEDFL